MKTKWYKFTWEDGIITIARGYDRTEMQALIRKHGQLVARQEEK